MLVGRAGHGLDVDGLYEAARGVVHEDDVGATGDGPDAGANGVGSLFPAVYEAVDLVRVRREGCFDFGAITRTGHHDEFLDRWRREESGGRAFDHGAPAQGQKGLRAVHAHAPGAAGG